MKKTKNNNNNQKITILVLQARSQITEFIYLTQTQTLTDS